MHDISYERAAIHVYFGKGVRREGDTDSDVNTVKEKIAAWVAEKGGGWIERMDKERRMDGEREGWGRDVMEMKRDDKTHYIPAVSTDG